VAEQLRKKIPGLETECVIIKTLGDRILDISLDKIGEKGVFVKELEQALLNGDVDFAVHSLKDMPSEHTPGLVFSPTPLREDPRDALVLKPEFPTLESLPQGARIGTGSKRRRYQLLGIRPDLEVVDIRGNIQTRISKIETENLHGIVLAAAGIHRTGLTHVISCYMDPETFVPAPAQGALAIQHCEGNTAVIALLETVRDAYAENCIRAERSFMKHTQGGCHAPVGALANIEKDILTLSGLFGNSDGSKMVRKSLSGSVDAADEIGRKLAESILEDLNHG